MIFTSQTWIAADWPLQEKLVAGCTTRQGGVSRSPYDSLNLGLHVGDEPSFVESNRNRLVDALHHQVPHSEIAWVTQVHGTRALIVDSPPDSKIEVDALVSAKVGLACSVMVADCLPVLLASEDTTVVAAAHAGWRGLAAGVLEETMQSAQQVWHTQHGFGACHPKWFAWLGPCISQAAFEVGDDVREVFIQKQAKASQAFRPGKPHHWYADLAALARMRLQVLGVDQIYGNDGSKDWCTFSNADRYFSYRRDSITGRMAAFIMRKL